MREAARMGRGGGLTVPLLPAAGIFFDRVPPWKSISRRPLVVPAAAGAAP